MSSTYLKKMDVQNVDQEVINQQEADPALNNKIDRRVRVRHVFSSTSEESFKHPLGRKPVGFSIAWQDRAGHIYSESEDRKWTSSKIYLTASVSGLVATLVLY